MGGCRCGGGHGLGAKDAWLWIWGFSDLICEPHGGRGLWIWVFFYLIYELYGGLSAMGWWLPT